GVGSVSSADLPNNVARLRSPVISTTSTRRRCRAICCARAAATVVLPTPPLPVTNSSRCTAGEYGPTLRGFKRIGAEGWPRTKIERLTRISPKQSPVSRFSLGQSPSDLRTLEPSDPRPYGAPAYASAVRSRDRPGHHRQHGDGVRCRRHGARPGLFGVHAALPE